MAITEPLRKYADHTALLARNQVTAEETYYPAIRELMIDILKSQRLPSDVRVNTIERRVWLFLPIPHQSKIGITACSK